MAEKKEAAGAKTAASAAKQLEDKALLEGVEEELPEVRGVPLDSLEPWSRRRWRWPAEEPRPRVAAAEVTWEK
jgi:hypothetical protein